MTLAVDASVATLWVLPQEGSQRAAALRSDERMIAPNLIAAEVGSAIWKAVRRGDIERTEATAALEIALLHLNELTPSEDLRVRTLELAIELDHPIYDCFYLALAERERCPLVTADKRLVAATKKFKGAEVRAL